MTEVERAVIDLEKTKSWGRDFSERITQNKRSLKQSRINTDQITSRKGKNLRFGLAKRRETGKNYRLR
jgi:hypothetical protein